MLKTYYQLTKPGIIYGNAMTAISGFLLAAVHTHHFDFETFVALVIGISLVIASACVFNNYIDRDIDKAMDRTKKRALVTHTISGRSALIYATILGLIGGLILGFYTNLLTFDIALLGFVVYVVFYGITKRKSVHGTVVGSISGAVPIVADFTAVTDHFGIEAFILGLILVCWQMPHFYAIALYRLKDYQTAGIPVLPAKMGVRATKIQMVGYTTAFVLASLSLTVYGYTGVFYFVIMAAVGWYWLWLSLQGFKNTRRRQMGQKNVRLLASRNPSPVRNATARCVVTVNLVYLRNDSASSCPKRPLESDHNDAIADVSFQAQALR